MACDLQKYFHLLYKNKYFNEPFVTLLLASHTKWTQIAVSKTM